jgi:hypothetical protein
LKHDKAVSSILLVVIFVVIIVVLGVIFLASQNYFGHFLIPNEPTPTPLADVVLSPSNQIVVVSLYQGASFDVQIVNNGNSGLKFPCSLTLDGGFTYTIAQIPYTTTQVVYGYGTYNIVFVQGMTAGNTAHVYATLQDSNGVSIRSNTVTVEYK